MKKLPKALLYDPYLTTLGGGEKYIAAFASALSERYDISIGAPELPETSQLQKLGFQDITESIRQIPLSQVGATSKKFDLLVYLANTLPPMAQARHNVLITQFPFERLPSIRRPLARRKAKQLLNSYQTHVVYSRYVQGWIKKRLGVSAKIISPAVELGSYSPAQKQNLIICVGRFFVGGHSKRQDIIIESFLRFQERSKKDWKLVLVGGVDNQPQNLNYLNQLQQQAARSKNIQFKVNASFTELKSLYSKASLFIHAAGTGRPAGEPERAEHFGITTVEAMSYGCVPLVYADGGQLEIVDKRFGYLWHSPDELTSTLQDIDAASDHLPAMAGQAVSASQPYDFDHFRSKINRYIP